MLILDVLYIIAFSVRGHAFDAAITFQPPVGGVVTTVLAVVEGSEILLTRKP